MLALNDLAFQNADILEALDERPGGHFSRRGLALHVNRDEANLGKTLKRLTAEGVLVDPPLNGLTDAGRVQLEAIRRARDPKRGQPRRAKGRGPFASFIPNPSNRPVTDAAVRALADTIEAAGDVIQPAETMPADANGVRMFLDGEHRWRACLLLEAEGRLPEALKAGLRFEEREATEAEQILIRIVTATARADLSPLDDARQLLALQQATGWSARDIAKKTGRSPADSDTGVRDVQVKIKVAKEATEFFLKQYELDGSWDRLRDSVTQPKPRLAPEQELSAALAEHGAAATGSGAPAETAAGDDWLLDHPAWALTTAETRSGLHNVELRIFGRIGDVPGWYVSVSTNLADGGMGESYRVSAANPIYSNRVEALQAARRRLIERHPLAAPWVRNWLDRQMGDHFVNGRDCLNASNAGEARRAAGLEPRLSNSGGGKSQGKSETSDAVRTMLDATHRPEIAPEAPTGPEDDRDAWNRTHNDRVADKALLAKVEAFIADVNAEYRVSWSREILAAIGVDGPFGFDEATNVVAARFVGAMHPAAFATVDVDAVLPPERARALAAMTAWALNRAFEPAATAAKETD